MERKGRAVVDTALCFIAYGLVQGDQLPLILYCSDEIVDNALGRAPVIHQDRIKHRTRWDINKAAAATTTTATVTGTTKQYILYKYIIDLSHGYKSSDSSIQSFDLHCYILNA